MTTTLENVNIPATPNLPLATGDYQRRYQDQFANVLRLYFNQLKAALGVLQDNQNTIQDEIDTASFILPVGSWYATATQAVLAINTPCPVSIPFAITQHILSTGDYVTGFVASIATTTMTVTSTTGVIEPGMVVTGDSVTAGTTIVKQLTGTAGSTGTYQVSISQTRSSASLTGTAASTTISSTKAGYFNFQFSFQLSKSSGGAAYIWIWPRINGIDVPDSNTKLAIQGTTSEIVAAWNFVLPLAVGDKFQLMWATDDAGVSILHEAPNSFSPAIPSAIVTATFVSGLY